MAFEKTRERLKNFDQWLSKQNQLENFANWISDIDSKSYTNLDATQSAQNFVQSLGLLIATPLLFVRDVFRVPLNIYRTAMGYDIVTEEKRTWQISENNQAPVYKIESYAKNAIEKFTLILMHIVSPLAKLTDNLMKSISTLLVSFFGVPLKTVKFVWAHLKNLFINDMYSNSLNTTRFESLVTLLGVAAIIVGLYFLAPVMIAAFAGYFAMPSLAGAVTGQAIASAAVASYTVTLEVLACAVVCLVTIGNVAMAGLGKIIDHIFHRPEDENTVDNVPQIMKHELDMSNNGNGSQPVIAPMFHHGRNDSKLVTTEGAPAANANDNANDTSFAV